MASNKGVVLLDGSNFGTWKIQMKMLLIKEGNWSIVNESEDVPMEPTEYRKYMARRDRALASIVLGIDHSLLYLLGDPEDPVIVWKRLCQQFQRKSWANKLALRRKLYGLKLKDDGLMQDHVKSMVEIFDELAVIGDEIEEEDRVVHILASMPERLNTIVTALEANTEVPSLDVVIERLLHEERKQKEKNTSQNVPIHDALIGQSQKSGKCFGCGKSGHKIRDCNAAAKKKKNVRNKFHTKEEVSSSDSSDNDDDDEDDGECEALIVIDQALSAVTDTEKWIIDSGASRHMCNDGTKFYKMRDLKQPQMVRVGNGYPVRVKSKGTVKLTIGKKNFKLRNVLFVPELKFNLLSVAQSAKAGKSFEFSEDRCKIVNIKTKKNVAVGNKVDGLYNLKVKGNEDVLVENTAICLAAMVCNPEKEITSVCNQEENDEKRKTKTKDPFKNIVSKFQHRFTFTKRSRR